MGTVISGHPASSFKALGTIVVAKPQLNRRSTFHSKDTDPHMYQSMSELANMVSISLVHLIYLYLG